MPMTRTPKRSIIEALVKLKTKDCIIAPGNPGFGGYGDVYVDGKYMGSHRYACFLVHGPPPPEHEASHSCGVRMCVNPRHLRWATHGANLADPRSTQTYDRGSILDHRQANKTQKQEALRQIVLNMHIDRQAGMLYSELGEKYEMSRNTVSRLMKEQPPSH